MTIEDDFDIDDFNKKTYRLVDDRTIEQIIDDQFIPIDDRTQQELEDDDYLSFESETEIENIDLKKQLLQNQFLFLNCPQITIKKLELQTK